jgi:hypothetical protein
MARQHAHHDLQNSLRHLPRTGWGKPIAFTGYLEQCKMHRKHANLGFSKTAVLKYHDGQTQDVYAFLPRLLNSLEDFAKELNM